MSTLHLSNGWYESPSKINVDKRKQSWERFKRHFRQFTAFMFSNVGIILLVIFYTIAGAFIFQGIEIFEYEKIKQDSETIAFLKERNHSNDYLQLIWSVTANNISFYNHWSFKNRVNEILLDYQRIIVKRESQTLDMEKQWSFSGAFLYSLTVITTIGYGNISPRSDWGKVVTILYAIIGMPLFLLYLSNIGDVLAKSFKWIYSKICLCRLCPGVAKRRLLRERRKLYHMSISRAMSSMDNTKVYYRKNESHANYDNNNNGCSFSNGVSSTISSSNSYSSTSNSSSNSNSNSNESSFTTTAGGESNISIDNILSTNLHLNASIHNSNIELARFIANDDIDVACVIQNNNGNIDEITVPLTICVLIMISYILWGALLFGRWEDWNYLDGSYFCFISLSSIGFGDLVPGDRVITAHKDKVEVSFILCAVYLLLGMALIAMCFNLMQEQVIHNIRAIKRAFKACFRCG